MSCSEPCTVDKKLYYFSKTRATFQEARTICKNKGGTLATNLDYHVYRQLNSCCTSQNQYWIGLRDDPVMCPSTSTEPYHWMEGGSCHDGQPLQIRRQPNNIDCQAITVSINTVNQDLPRAYESDCPSPHHYICQFTSSKMLPTTAPKFFHSLTTTSTYADSPTLDGSPLKTWVIAGGVIGFAIFVLLLIALSCIYHKKKTNNKKKKETIKRNIILSTTDSTTTVKTSTSTFTSNNNNELTRNGSYHHYCRVDDPVEGITKSTRLPKGSTACLETLLESEDGYERIHRSVDYIQPYENVFIENETKIILQKDAT